MAAVTKLVLLTVLVAASAGAAVAIDLATDCAILGAKMSACVPYLESGDTPTSECCKAAGEGFATKPLCFCSNLKKYKDFINITVANQLASVCSVEPPHADCHAQGSSPKPSPLPPSTPQTPKKSPPKTLPAPATPGQQAGPTQTTKSDGYSLTSSCAVIISSLAFIIFSVSMV